MNELCYTALGDSITGGVAARLCDGFAYRLCRYLKLKCGFKSCKNLGIPGLTSGELLYCLRNSPRMRFASKNADLITISIGGNNLMHAASRDYSHISKKAANRGVLSFSRDWPAILDCIRRDIGSEANLLTMTLFNPYPCSSCNHSIVDMYINQLNSIIANPTFIEVYSYSVVDVYKLFKLGGSRCLTFFNEPFGPILRSPHPNQEGHRLIAKAFIGCVNSSCTNLP